MSRYTFSPTGWYATFKNERWPSGVAQKPVEAWSPAGDALVVDRERGQLVPARTQPGFSRLERCRKATTVIPAGPGWRVRQVDPPEPTTIVDVIAWAVYEDEDAEPAMLPVTTATGWARAAIADVDRDDSVTLLAPDTPNPPDPTPNGDRQ